VDGVEVPTQMLAPAMVGIPVPAGEHQVRLEYHPYPGYLLLIAAGAAAILGLGALGRRGFLGSRSISATS
jgi:uncharacterized membrane protein YfhO